MIFITYDHPDHFSPKDIAKVSKADTFVVLPEKMKDAAGTLSIKSGNIVFVKPAQALAICGIPVETVATIYQKFIKKLIRAIS